MSESGDDRRTDGDGLAVVVPGGRDVRGTLDRADGAEPEPERDGTGPDAGNDSVGDASESEPAVDPAAGTAADACLVACPPHPQHRGHRGDRRLVAVADAVGAAGVDALRIDYGDWDAGRGERVDVRNAVAWAGERYDRVGLFGFSFGGTLALSVAADPPIDGVAAVSALAPTARIGDAVDAVTAMDAIAAPAQVVYATRDDTADWRPAVERARDLGWALAELSADHFFVGQTDAVADAAGGFLADHL